MLTNASYSFVILFSILCFFVCLIVVLLWLFFFFFFLVVFFFFFLREVSLCSHGLLQIHKDTPPSATWVLGLKACTTW